MKFIIKFTYITSGEVTDGEMRVWAEDARYALRLVESELDILNAKVTSVTPL